MTSLAPAAPPRSGAPDPASAHEAAAAVDGTRITRREQVGVAIGVVVVLVHAAATLRTSLWLDEAYTLGAVNDLGFSIRETHGTMAAYYAVVSGWGLLGTAAWWLRLPSVACALATLFVTRSVARRVGGPDLAAVAVPLLALLPVFEWKAVEARSYSMATLLISVAWYLGVRAVQAPTDRDQRRWWLLLVPLGIVGSLTHGLFPVHLAPLVALAALGPRPGVALRRLAPGMVAAGGTALALRASGASKVGTHTSGGPAEWVRSALHELLPGSSLVWLVLFGAVAAGLAASIRRARRARTPVGRALAAVPALWAVAPCATLAVLSLAVPTFNARYLAPVTPGLALCLGLAACAVAARIDRGTATARLAVAGTVVGAVLVASFATGIRPDLQDWDAAAEIVAADVRPGDALVFATLVDGERPPFEAAWSALDPAAAPTVLTSDRPLGEVRRYESDFREVPEVGAAAAAHDRVWVVDGGFPGKAGGEVTLQDPGFADLEEVGRWTVDGGIEVTLHVRRA